VLVERERAVQVFHRRRHQIGEVTAGERPVPDAPLARRQTRGVDFLELENTSCRENTGGQGGDPVFFRFSELDGVAGDLAAARYEVGERLRRWSLDGTLHESSLML